MYWTEVLEEIFSKAPESSLLTLSSLAPNETVNIEVLPSRNFVIKENKEGYNKFLTIYNPFRILFAINKKWDGIIINEATLYSFISIILWSLLRKKTIVLVESSHLNHFTTKLNKLQVFLRKTTYSLATNIVTNNLSGKDFVASIIGKNNKTHIITYLTSELPKSTSKFNPFENYKDAKNIIIVGQLVERKGTLFILDYIHQLQKEESNLNINFHFIGSGKLDAYCKKYKEEKGLNRTIFHGKVDYSLMINYYENADCIVIPTLLDYRSLVPFEAVNSGLPILHSIYDGSHFETQKFGVAFDPKSFDSFHSGLNKILFVAKNDFVKSQVFSVNQIIQNWKKILTLFDNNSN
jgi:hypothetical protein